MPVPPDDIVCRFINPIHWSRRENQPREGAFKQEGLSIWHQGRLLERKVNLEDLLIENLAGYGQVHHTARDYTELARDLAEKGGEPFEVQVEWRPEDQYVPIPWRQWNYAHAQVEAIAGPAQFLRRYRKLLTVNSRILIPPATL